MKFANPNVDRLMLRNKKLLAEPKDLILEGGTDYLPQVGIEFIMRQIDNGTPIGLYSLHLWQKVRSLVINRDNGECQLCKYNGILTVVRPMWWVRENKLDPRQVKTPAVHHMCEWLDYPQFVLHTNNLITLCEECHTATHLSGVEIETGTYDNFDSTEIFD